MFFLASSMEIFLPVICSTLALSFLQSIPRRLKKIYPALIQFYHVIPPECDKKIDLYFLFILFYYIMFLIIVQILYKLYSIYYLSYTINSSIIHLTKAPLYYGKGDSDDPAGPFISKQ